MRYVTDANGYSRQDTEGGTRGNDTNRHRPTTPTRLPPAGVVPPSALVGRQLPDAQLHQAIIVLLVTGLRWRASSLEWASPSSHKPVVRAGPRLRCPTRPGDRPRNPLG